jgi:hypothetical protein
MSSQVTPKKNAAYSFYCALTSQANTNTFQSSATLTTGDVKVSVDGAALNNITTLPVVTPAASKAILVSLTSTEMNGDNIQVIFSDAAGAEWADALFNIQTTARQIDDLAYPSYQVPDAVPADGTRPTIEQCLYMIIQFLTERAVSGTTMTVNKPDGSTALMTFTLNNAASPTSITRAS